VTGLACPSVVLPRIPLLTRLAGFNFRNGGCRSPRKLWTGFSSGGKSEKIGVPKCLIHGVGGGGGGGGGFWEGADSSDNNHFALSKGSFRKVWIPSLGLGPGPFVLDSFIFPVFPLHESEHWWQWEF